MTLKGAVPGAVDARMDVDTADLPGAARQGSGLRAAAWTISGFGAGQLLRFASNLVLTRLLFPEAFGIMALVLLFTQALGLFSDVGSGPAIVQSEHGDEPRFLNTAWTVEVVRGGVLWIGTILIARPVASFYGHPILAEMLPVAGLLAVMDGFRAKSFELAHRHVRLGRLNVVELTAQAVGAVAMILLALLHRALYGPKQPGAVWALLGGVLVAGLAKSLLSHVAMPGIRHRLHIDRASLRILLGFTRWIILSTALTFFATQADRLVFGKTIPLDLFGVYGIAAALATMPTQVIQTLSRNVLFPVLSRVDSGSLQALFWRARLPLVVGGGAAAAALMAGGPFAVGFLYDSRYLRAGWILQFLAAAGWIQSLESTVGAVLIARARLKWVAAGNATKLVSLVILVPLGLRLGGFRGALCGLVLSDAAKYAVAAFAARRDGLHVAVRDTGMSLAVAVSGLVGMWAGRAAFASTTAYLPSLVVAGGVAASPWAVAGLALLRRRDARERAHWSSEALTPTEREGHS